jgi:hypothetical protein
MLNKTPKEPIFSEAKLRYDDGEYHVVQQGTFVRCAVSNQPIQIEDLKYWSVDHQEAYASPELVLKRYYPEAFSAKVV